MSAREKIQQAVYSAVDAFNAFQSKEQQLEKDSQTILFSRAGFTKEGKLDSLGLVNFLAIVEEKTKVEFGDNFVLDIPGLIENKEKLLKDLGSLMNYLESALKIS